MTETVLSSQLTNLQKRRIAVGYRREEQNTLFQGVSINNLSYRVKKKLTFFTVEQRSCSIDLSETFMVIMELATLTLENCAQWCNFRYKGSSSKLLVRKLQWDSEINYPGKLLKDKYTVYIFLDKELNCVVQNKWFCLRVIKGVTST